METEATLKERLDSLLSITETDQATMNRRTVYQFVVPRLCQACHDYLVIHEKERNKLRLLSSHSATGYSRVTLLLNTLTEKLGLNPLADGEAPLLAVQNQLHTLDDAKCSENLGVVDTIFRDLIKNHRIGTHAFTGDPFKADATSFGFLVIKQLIAGMGNPIHIQGETHSVMGKFIQEMTLGTLVKSTNLNAFNLTPENADALAKKLVPIFKNRYEKS